MKLFKLTALASLCIALTVSIVSCEKDAEKDRVNVYSKSDIPATGAQIAPTPSPSAATGKLAVSYDKRAKVLNYTISWTGLSDSVMAIRVSGPAPTGYSSLRAGYSPASATADTTSPYNVYQQVAGNVLVSSNANAVTSTKKLAPTGSFSGSVQIDGVKLKEEELLSGLYYITVHPKTVLPGTAPASLFYRWFGEIRAQIKFQ
ncbi:MAG: CHRD domain-containing protein [Chitinophagaceae bacterium]